MRHTFGQFIWRRARRILAPYYAALILSLLFIAVTGTARTETIWDDSVGLTWRGVTANVLAAQNWFGAQAFGQINYVFWSVAVEWNIYFFFPLILWLWAKLGSRALATGLILPVTIALAWYWKDGPRSYHNIQFLGLFALGMYAANLALTKQPSSALRLISLGLALVVSLIVVIITAKLGWMRANHLWPLLDLGVGVPTAALLVYLVHSPNSRLRQILTLKPLVAVGLFSYSIYLVHAPIIQGVWLLSNKTLGLSFFPTLGVMLAVGLPLVVALSYAFHLVFERPFLNSPAKP